MQNILNEKKQIKQREIYLDWICGLMILQMIFGHLLGFSDLGNLPGWFEANHVLSFFMPWFFFKSGMFFHSEKSWKDTVKSSWLRLMVPFLVFSIIGYILFVLKLFFFRPEATWKWYMGGITQLFKVGNILENGPLWYLLSLFLIKIGYWLCCKYCIKDGILLSLCLIIPSALYYTEHNGWLLLSHTLLGMFFFVSGYRLKNAQFKKHVLGVAIFCFMMILLLNPSHVDMFHATLEYGNYFLYFVYSLASVILINNIIKFTPQFVIKG